MHWGDLLLRGLFWGGLVLEGIRRVCSLRHAVYWNSSNQRFLRDDYSVQVDINDYLDIYCPHYESNIPSEHTESFTLYMVDREGYEGCYETPGAFKRWECNKPYAPFGPIRFSEKIQRFTPFSLGFEFRPGEDYYYISAPTIGSVGSCLKLLVSVCCPPSTMKSQTEIPKSQPRGRGGAGGRTMQGKTSGQGDATRTTGNSARCTEPPGWLHIFSFTLLLLLLLHH